MVFVSGITALYLSIRQLKISCNNSILAWNGLIYTFIMNLGALSFPLLSHPATLLHSFNYVTLSNLYVGLIIINLILTGQLFLLHLIFKHNTTITVTEFHKDIYKRNRYLIIFCAVGLFIYVTSPTVQEKYFSFWDIIISRDYIAYYQLRVDSIFENQNSDPINSFIEKYQFLFLLPVMNLNFLHLWITSKNFIWKRYWIFSLVMLIIISILSMQKAPIVILFLSNLVVLILNKINKKQLSSELFIMVFRYFLFILAFIYLVYTLLGFEDGIFFELAGRVIVEPIVTAYAHFVVFPDMHPHTFFGNSLLFNPLTFFQKPLYLSELKLPYQITSLYATGSAFNMNTSILGDGWANYGYLGIIYSAFIMFGIFFFWDFFLEKKYPNLPKIPLLSYYIGNSIFIINTGAQTVLLAYGMAFIPAIYLMLYSKYTLKVFQKST